MIVLFAEAMEKISALESELARLKAQIAVYALSEASNIPEGLSLSAMCRPYLNIYTKTKATPKLTQRKMP